MGDIKAVVPGEQKDMEAQYDPDRALNHEFKLCMRACERLKIQIDEKIDKHVDDGTEIKEFVHKAIDIIIMYSKEYYCRRECNIYSEKDKYFEYVKKWEDFDNIKKDGK